MLEQQITSFANFLLETRNYGRVLVTGRAKSGTTWLARILRAHPQVAMRGERKLLEKTGPYEPLLRPFLTGDHFHEWFQYSSARNKLDPEEVPPELARVVSDYLLYLTVDPRGVTHFGDKMAFVRPPDVPFAFKSVRKMHANCRVVNIVRDGRDSIVSGQFHRYRNALKSGNLDERTQRIDSVLKGEVKRLFTDEMISHMARSWSGVVRNTDKFGPEVFGDSFLSISYEGLKSNTLEITTQVFAHLELAHDEQTVQEVVEETSFERLSGRKSGTADPKSNFRQGASGDWRNYFTKRDSKLFAEAANDMLLAQGYETESEWFRCI